MYGGYSGLGGLSSSYNSFSGMGSYGGVGSQPRTYGAQGVNAQNNGNNREQDPEKNSRKMVVQQWFKLMGGLRSILELGLAAIAIANFYSHISAMTKKIAEVIKTMLGGIMKFLHKRVTGRVISKLTNPNTRTRALKHVLVSFVRVFSVLLLCLAAKLRSQLKKESQQKLQKLEQEYEKCKKGELSESQRENVQKKDLQEITIQNANL